MDMYQHDGATMFRFVLRGELAGDRVRDLEHAWITAKSILSQKQLVVDVSGVSNADPRGIELLSRLREAGACLTATPQPESAEFIRSLGVVTVTPDRRRFSIRAQILWRLVRFWGGRGRYRLSNLSEVSDYASASRS
jgi:ABC-type transporter Mla MlaB component